jgi:outer membrane biosynthesis protein TonB
VVLVLCLFASFARADKRNPVEKLANDAAEAYRVGDYRKATELLERAYKIEKVSALLYNLAKAYEKLGEPEKAADLYQRYAGSEDADPKLKQKAEARVAALREPVAPSNGKRPDRPVEPQPKNEPPPKNEPVVTRPVEPPPPPPPDPNAERRARERSRTVHRAVGLTLVGIGAATLAAAVGLSVNALQLNNQFKNSTDEIDKKIALNNAVPQALAADVLYGVTGAALGVSIYFLYKGFKPDPKLAVAPTLGGFTVAGVF